MGGRPIDFIKLQSCGKDYILIDGTRGQLPPEDQLPAFSRRITRRRLGIGGYGLIMVEGPTPNGIRARLYGRDGFETDFPGDALRCLGRYAYDAGMLQTEDAEITVGESSFAVDMIDSQNIMVGLGEPRDPRTSDRLQEDLTEEFTMTLSADDMEYTCTPIRLVGMHAALFVPDYMLDLRSVAETVAEEPVFRSATRTEFIRVYSQDAVHIRSLNEQGTEEPCSGDSSAAAVVASVLNGLTGHEVLVHNRGGNLFVEWEEETGSVFVTAPVTYLFTGIYDGTTEP